MLIDALGYYFGDKVLLDVIVEADTSEAVLLAEMMDSVDMSQKFYPDHPGFNGSLSAR